MNQIQLFFLLQEDDSKSAIVLVVDSAVEKFISDIQQL